MKHSIWAIAAVVAICAVVRIPHASAATYSRTSELVIPATGTSVTLFDGRFTGGASIAAADITGDGVDEYIVGAGQGSTPIVQVLDANGEVITSWMPYKENFRGGVNVAAGDLDGDGQAEIVTAPLSDAPATIRVFKNTGGIISSFRAFDSRYHEGANIAVLEAMPDSPGRIIVSTRGLRKNEALVYATNGNLVRRISTDVGRDHQTGVTVAAGWSDAWHERIIVFGAGRDSAPRVMVYGLDSKKVLLTWMAFKGTMTTGVSISYRNNVVAVAPLGLGVPTIRTFTAIGDRIGDVDVFESTFRGGVNVALSAAGSGVTVAAVPNKANPSQAKVNGKKILVNLKKQELYLVENGTVISTRRISSGKWGTPTPVGTFKTRNKITVAYSKPYKLYMEYWMAITADGKYGLHSLPYWKTKNGKLYEGAAHIGTPVSHGCIRQTVAEAKSLYDWAPVGTPVVISKG